MKIRDIDVWRENPINISLEDIKTDIEVFENTQLHFCDISITDSIKKTVVDIRKNRYLKIRKRNLIQCIDKKKKHKKDIILADINTTQDNSPIKKIQQTDIKHIPIKNKKLLKKTQIKQYYFNQNTFWKIFSDMKNISIFTKNRYKNMIIFFVLILGLLFINALGVKTLITSWYNDLILMKSNNIDIFEISKKTNKIYYKFKIANFLYTPFKMIPEKNLENGNHILQSWTSIAYLWNKISALYIDSKKYIDKNWWIDKLYLTDFFESIYSEVDLIIRHIYNILIHLKAIKDIWNQDVNNKILFAQEQLTDIYKKIDLIHRNYEVFLNILWSKNQKKYLVVFQNNDELRPSGWFMWSMWLVTLNKGKIIDFQTSDVYNYEWRINKVFTDFTAAPKWLQDIAWNFRLRDANFYLDYSRNSEFIKERLSHIDIHLDGILYINKQIIIDLLKITGPIEFNNHIITDENFSFLFSTLVEAKVSKEGTLWTPKKVLFDFWEVFIQKILTEKKYIDYINEVYKKIKSRDIVLYSFVPQENSLLWKLGINWDKQYIKTLDFNYPVFSSVGWNKTDRYIHNTYNKNIEIGENCSIYTYLEIERKHYFSNAQRDNILSVLQEYNISQQEEILRIQWEGINKSYVRVVLPKNAIIKPSKNMDISTYDAFQVVDFYMLTEPMKTSQVKIEYQLLNPECKPYDFKLYKQSGIIDYNIWINNELYENIATDFYFKKYE